jgi:hypothetical protein
MMTAIGSLGQANVQSRTTAKLAGGIQVLARNAGRLSELEKWLCCVLTIARVVDTECPIRKITHRTNSFHDVEYRRCYHVLRSSPPPLNARTIMMTTPWTMS